jgi:hypothetical protein
MSYPTVAGQAVEGVPFRAGQVCLGPAFAQATYKFFVTGTSTPANVYQNGTLTTAFPITGQVTADNFGRFPAIYLDTSVTYKVQFFNKLNVLVWTRDPYIPPLSTIGTSSLSAFGFSIAPTGELTIPAPNTGGSGVSLTLISGLIGSAALRIGGTLAGNSALIVNNSATTGVRTATFTATNKPGTATSAPAGWLPITCDGVQYYAPIWHGNPFTPYSANPSAQGQTIVATSAVFGGNGLTTPTGGTASPSNWYQPTSAGIGAGYYINITKTGGLSGLAFTAAQGAWTNIGAGGLTIAGNAQATITGTYQLSTSAGGSPVVASGTITLSNNNGVQQPTYNGASTLAFNSNGTATLNGVTSSSWYAPTTASIGSSYYVSVTQTGGAGTFTGISGIVNIGAGVTLGVTGSGVSFSATGTYTISSDAAGLVVLGSGSVTLTGASVQSPNYSGTTPLVLGGNGAATVNGAGASSWYSPNASNVGSGFWINITRTSGTTGVNFSAAQGSWTNITNGGLTIDMSGYTGDVGIVTVGGTYQISSSSSGSPVLGSGTISLSVNAGTVTRTYTSGSGTETIPTGATTVVIEVWGGGGSGSSSNSSINSGGSGAYGKSSYSATPGQTMSYVVGGIATSRNGGGGSNLPGLPGNDSSVSSGTFTISSPMTATGGHDFFGLVPGCSNANVSSISGTLGPNGAGNGVSSSAPGGGTGGTYPGGNASGVGSGGAAAANNSGTSGIGARGQVQFTYS